MDRESARRQLLEIYAGALQAVAGDALVERHLAGKPIAGPVYAVAIGKAAEAMAAGAQQALGAQLHRGLLITKRGYLSKPFAPHWVCVEAGHPVPDSDSLRAGSLLLDYLHHIPADGHLLFLLSGGASALVEVLPDGVPPGVLQQINQWLLGSGLDIDAVNRVRKGVSALKAGRLAGCLQGQRVTQLLFSDVPGSDPHVIGSGLLIPHTAVDLAVAHLPLPEWIGEVVARAPPLPAPHQFAAITTHLLASNRTARLAAQHEAARRGIATVLHDYDFQGDAALLGREFARTLLASARVLHIWGGEATLRLPQRPGRGGRCQQLALCAATELADTHGVLLAAGTDGSDGPGEDAGALVDGETVARGEREGATAQLALQQADAGSFLEASGDLIQTGPTGSNVMDLVLGWLPA